MCLAALTRCSMRKEQNRITPCLPFMEHARSTPPGVRRSTAQRTAILAFAVLQILTPLLPSLGVGDPIGERSDAVDTILTPAGWAFSIWGPLYASCLAYAIYQALPAQRTGPLLNRIGWFTTGAFLGNAAWAAYTQIFGLSLISVAIILFTLICLLAVYRAFANVSDGFSRGEQWLVVLPLSALAAWLTAASIVNVSASLQYHGVEGGSATAMIGAAVIVVGGFIAAAALWKGHGNPWYALAFLWALGAIYAAGGQESALVAVAVVVSAILVVGSTIGQLTAEANRQRWFHRRKLTSAI